MPLTEDAQTAAGIRRRRARCKIPDEVRHREKWRLALDMLDEITGGQAARRWGLLRHLICQAATAAGADPWRMPFARTLRAGRRFAHGQAAFPPERLARALRRAIRKLGARIRKKRRRPGSSSAGAAGTPPATAPTAPCHRGILHIWRLEQPRC
jgi:hypothetical protein